MRVMCATFATVAVNVCLTGCFTMCVFPLQVSEMLLELCVTELEDVASDSEYGRSTAHPVIQESPHPYTDDTSISGHVKIAGRRLLACCLQPRASGLRSAF